MDITTVNIIIGGAIGIIGAVLGAIINGTISRSNVKLQISQNKLEIKRQLRNLKLEEIKAQVNESSRAGEEIVNKIVKKIKFNTPEEQTEFGNDIRMLSYPSALDIGKMEVYAPEIADKSKDYYQALFYVQGCGLIYLHEGKFPSEKANNRLLEMLNLASGLIKDIETLIYQDSLIK